MCYEIYLTSDFNYISLNGKIILFVMDEYVYTYMFDSYKN